MKDIAAKGADLTILTGMAARERPKKPDLSKTVGMDLLITCLTVSVVMYSVGCVGTGKAR